MMTQQLLYEWIANPDRLNRDTLYELRTLLARYPYFQTARLLYLKNLYLLHDVSFGEELRRAALYVADRKVMFYLIEGEHFVIKPQEKPDTVEAQPGLDRTLSLIDAFLSAYADEPSSLRATVPMEVSTDYASLLLKGEETGPDEATPPMKGQDLIDGFLEKASEEDTLPPLPTSPEKEDEADNTEEEAAETEEEDIDDESYFTETLAKIYIKQQRYSKAIEIIKKLNLKYPKKNAYFADQIRFLEKLIINTKSK